MTDNETNLALWIAFFSINEQAMRDWLTGLHNRRYFEETLIDHLESATRYNRKLSLILFDIDGLKKINDSQGHDAGDYALRQFSNHLKSSARKADIICRYGGDEFAIILPETGKAEASILAERIKKTSKISATAGIASLPSTNLISEADTDLFEKKRTS